MAGTELQWNWFSRNN